MLAKHLNPDLFVRDVEQVPTRNDYGDRLALAKKSDLHPRLRPDGTHALAFRNALPEQPRGGHYGTVHAFSMHRRHFLSAAGSALALIVTLGAGCGRREPPLAPPPVNVPPVNTPVNTAPVNTTQPPPPPTNAPVDTPPSADGRVRGTSTGAFPYAPFDTARVVTRNIGQRGGVLTTMAGPTKVALVVPPGNLVQSVEVTLAPYAALPAGPRHIPLSTAYGYGVQVSVTGLASTQLRDNPAYLVFDTTGGRAMDALRNAQRDPWNRCDPQSIAFDPVVCAAERGVPAAPAVEPTAAVVTPIHRQNAAAFPIVFTRTTIPIGIAGLIVAEMPSGDVYIPQPMTPELLRDLITATGPHNGNTVERLELVARVIATNQLATLSTEMLSTLSGLNGDTPPRALQSLTTAPAFAAEITRRYNASTENSTERMQLETLAEEYPKFSAARATEFFADAEFETKGRYPGDLVLPFAAAVLRLARGGNTDASSIRDRMAVNLRAQLTNERPGAARWSRFDGYESLLLFRSRTVRAALTDAEFDAMLNDLQNRARADAEGAFNDANASIDDLIRAAELALSDLVDDADLFDKIWDKIEELLKQALDGATSREEAESIAGRAFALEIDGLGNAALEKAATLPRASCDELIKKNLKNYGMNRCDF